MKIIFECNNCFKTIQVDGSLQGEFGRCPRCRAEVYVPMADDTNTVPDPAAEENSKTANETSSPDGDAAQASEQELEPVSFDELDDLIPTKKPVEKEKSVGISESHSEDDWEELPTADSTVDELEPASIDELEPVSFDELDTLIPTAKVVTQEEPSDSPSDPGAKTAKLQEAAVDEPLSTAAPAEEELEPVSFDELDALIPTAKVVTKEDVPEAPSEVVAATAKHEEPQTATSETEQPEETEPEKDPLEIVPIQRSEKPWRQGTYRSEGF